MELTAIGNILSCKSSGDIQRYMTIKAYKGALVPGVYIRYNPYLCTISSHMSASLLVDYHKALRFLVASSNQ